jgi:hypothetical protein
VQSIGGFFRGFLVMVVGSGLGPDVVGLPHREGLQAAPPTIGRYTQGVFGKRVKGRVPEGIRTPDTQIHNQPKANRLKRLTACRAGP